jgi:hypothetical protein
LGRAGSGNIADLPDFDSHWTSSERGYLSRIN